MTYKKRLLKILLAAGALMAVLVACRKDLGNYNYSSINVISVTTDTANANRLMVINNDSLVVKQGDTLKVNVIVSQSNQSDDLSFSWMVTQRNSTLNNPGQYVIASVQQLNTRILLTPALYNLVLKTTDNKTGVSYYKTYVLNVSTPPWGNEGWLVLEDQAANGGCDLSVITSRDGVSRGTVYSNVYSLANGHKLPFDTYKVNVISHSTTVGSQKVSFFYPDGGLQVRSYDFSDSSTNDTWFAVSPANPNFQFNGAVPNGNYEFQIVNNQLYYRLVSKNTMATPPIYFSAPVMGTWTFAPFVINNNTLSDYAVTLYDQANRSFLLFNASTASMLPTTLPDVPNKHLAAYAGTTAALDPITGSGFDMNNMGKNLVYTENAQPLPSSSSPTVYDCFFRNNGGDSTWLIELPTNAVAYTNNNNTGRFLLRADSLPGINTASLFACPTFLTMPGKFYYATGSDIYTSTVRAYPAYTGARSSISFPAGTVIKTMKVFKSGYTVSAVPATESRVLTVATDETTSGGGYKVYFFNINIDGDIVGTPTQVYTGFNKIVDIVFKKGLGL